MLLGSEDQPGAGAVSGHRRQLDCQYLRDAMGATEGISAEPERPKSRVVFPHPQWRTRRLVREPKSFPREQIRSLGLLLALA